MAYMNGHCAAVGAKLKEAIARYRGELKHGASRGTVCTAKGGGDGGGAQKHEHKTTMRAWSDTSSPHFVSVKPGGEGEDEQEEEEEEEEETEEEEEGRGTKAHAGI